MPGSDELVHPCLSSQDGIGVLEPWRNDSIPFLLLEPRVAGKLSRLIHRLQEPWTAPLLKEWEQQHVAPIIAIIDDVRRYPPDERQATDVPEQRPERIRLRSRFASGEMVRGEYDRP
ncbi:MAG TPA: hypothetical protein VII08_05680 [Myxococcales bacterium]